MFNELLIIIIMTKYKYTYEQVKEMFEKEGYTIKSKEYISGQKLQYICSNNHESKINFFCFLRGRRCKICYREKNENGNKLTIDQVKDEFKKHLMILVSNEYVNCNTPLEYMCEFKHINKCSYALFKKKKYKCSECA